MTYLLADLVSRQSSESYQALGVRLDDNTPMKDDGCSSWSTVKELFAAIARQCSSAIFVINLAGGC